MTPSSTGERREPRPYEIRIKGHLEPRWSVPLGGLAITNESNGSSILRGVVPDQAALHGLLQKIRDLGLPLISVTEVVDEHQPSPIERHTGS